MIKQVLVPVLLCVLPPCTSTTALAQSGNFQIPAPAVTTPASKPATAAASPAPSSYADEAVVVESSDAVYHFAADGTGSKLEDAVVRVQAASALQSFGVLSFPYASESQRLDIVYVRVRKPDGTVVETPVADAVDQPAPATQAAPMYSDLHLKQIPVRSLAVGDKLEFQVRMTVSQPDAPGEFYGQENFGLGIVYLKRDIELRVPANKHLTVYSPAHMPVVSDEGEERVYRWAGSQLRSPSAKDDASPENLSPVAWTTFTSWEAVGQWYATIAKGRDDVTPALQAKADELTANAKTDMDKVRALYEYVSAHNHYIGVDFGIGRYQPHRAAEVLASQYGDCKDKHTLLAALLRAKGFPVSSVLIGAGVELNEKVPMPSFFNHVLTLTQVGSEPVWLDTTTEVAPFRVLLATLRDKDALVIPDSGVPLLEKTPTQLPFPAMLHYEAKVELQKTGSLKGDVDLSLRGDDEVYLRLAARQMTRGQWDQFGQSVANEFGFSGTATHAILDPPDETSGPWHLRFDYTQEPFSDWVHYRIGALLPTLSLPQVDEKKPPTREIELGGPRTLLYETSTHLPAGYSVELPDAVHVKTPFASFDRTYRVADGSLYAMQKVEMLSAKLPAAQWKEYKKFLDDIPQEPWVQVTALTTGKDRADGEKGPPAAGENNTVAAELVRQTYTAIVAKDYDLARKKSDQALAVNDKQAYLWSQRGFLAGMAGNYTEAADDYERELKQHPEAVDQYAGLIDAQGRAGRKEQQRLSLLAYAKASPANEQVVLYTAALLLSSDHVGDALGVYRAGAKALPESKLIQVELASALLRSGGAEEAVPLLKTVLENTADPNLLNSAAYVLASHKIELPLAETAARKAVGLLEAESAQVELSGVNASSFNRVNLLLATWDTLGWIYFTEGKTDLAEPYIRAAWRNSAAAEEGLHLGEVLEQRDKLPEAMQAYELALAGRAAVTPDVANDLHTRVDALKKRKIPSQYARADTVLQDRRTLHIPRPEGLKGSAIFITQVSATKTEKMEMLSGDDALRGLASTLAGLDLGLAVPKDSRALLLRTGVLFCSAEPTCEFVLTPPTSANIK